MKYDFAKNQGITLISLVITIIVLLILAGVSIYTLTGDNGLITKAKNAKDLTNITQAQEQLQLAYINSLNNNAEIDKSKLIDNINSIGDFTVEEQRDNKYMVIVTENKTGITYGINSQDGTIDIIDNR